MKRTANRGILGPLPFIGMNSVCVIIKDKCLLRDFLHDSLVVNVNGTLTDDLTMSVGASCRQHHWDHPLTCTEINSMYPWRGSLRTATTDAAVPRLT